MDRNWVRHGEALYHGMNGIFDPRHASLAWVTEHMAKKQSLDWTLALRLRLGFGGERPAPGSADHVKMN